MVQPPAARHGDVDLLGVVVIVASDRNMLHVANVHLRLDELTLA